MSWCCNISYNKTMALICRLSSTSTTITNNTSASSLVRKFQRMFCNQVLSSSSPPLLQKLLQTPKSKIKTTLDSDDTLALNASLSSWDSLLTTLRSYSPEKAQLVLEWKLEKLMKGNEKCRDGYSSLISLCGKSRNVSLALRVFTCMEACGIKPDSSVFDSLVSACLCSGDVVTALSLFEIMMGSSEDCKPSSETYDAFISGFSSLGRADLMHKWYLAKRAAGFSDNVRTYESLVLGCVKSRDFDGADRYFKQMVSLGFMPSVFVVENVLDGLCKCRDLVKVEEFVTFLIDGEWEISVNMVDKLVKLYCEVGEADKMEELLVRLSSKANESRDVLQKLHCGIIRVYAVLHRLDDVEHSVRRMRYEGFVFECADDVEKVICSYFRCKAYDRLDQFLDEIKSYYKLTRSTYDCLIAGYQRAGLSEKSDLVMNDMKLAGIL